MNENGAPAAMNENGAPAASRPASRVAGVPFTQETPYRKAAPRRMKMDTDNADDTAFYLCSSVLICVPFPQERGEPQQPVIPGNRGIFGLYTGKIPRFPGMTTQHLRG